MNRHRRRFGTFLASARATGAIIVGSAFVVFAQDPAPNPSLNENKPSWCQDLRLVGVTSLGGLQTAYFSDSSGKGILLLSVGETFDGLKLDAIEERGDAENCRAIVSRNQEEAVIRMEEYGAEKSGGVTGPPSQPEPAASEERVAVKPWRNPKARKDLQPTN